jgi:hypothetical protein
VIRNVKNITYNDTDSKENSLASLKNKSRTKPDRPIYTTIVGMNVPKFVMKLLQFHENYRPPYFGSFRKDSKAISPRAPFRTDHHLFQYDIDSEEEWEDEEEGESLSSGSDEEKSEEGYSEDEDDVRKAKQFNKVGRSPWIFIG